jgi:thiol-disulfide isomerase/thioredoxin
MKFLYSFILSFFILSTSFGQEVQKVSDHDLKSLLSNVNNKLYVINFWATWCGPCIKEIPHFEKVAAEFPSHEVEFIMVSLDFPSQLEKTLIPFIKKNNMKLNVILVEDMDYDKWIRDVDKDWQGNIPVTLFFNNSKDIRRFESKALEESELRDIIHDLI